MNIDTINKIKSNINPKFAELFTKDDLLEFNFIPINKQSGFLFVVIKEGSDKSVIAQAISAKDSDTVKFISFDTASFSDFLDYYISEYYIKDGDNSLETFAETESSVSAAEPASKRVLLPGESPDDIPTLSENSETISDQSLEQANIEQDNPDTDNNDVSANIENNDTSNDSENSNNQAKQQPQYEHGPKKRLGEMLISQGLLTNDQLVEALTASKKTATPIGSTSLQ